VQITIAFASFASEGGWAVSMQSAKKRNLETRMKIFTFTQRFHLAFNAFSFKLILINLI